MGFQITTDQVDVEAVCKKHNLGRYDLIQLATTVARSLNLRPHDAIKRIYEIDDLEEFLINLKAQEVERELKRQLRKN
tara:strand:- start:9848 stop:10081 length:234 start_codon:yes stop_codon:yes gene_type:complete